MEEWKEVAGFEGLYKVSSEGRVVSLGRSVIISRGRRSGTLHRFPEKILKADVVKSYEQVTLYKDLIKYRFKVHQLVCQAFHGDKPVWAQVVAHKDGNPRNNNSSNVEWSTHKSNTQDSIRHGTKVAGEKHHCVYISDKDLTEMVREYKILKKDKKYIGRGELKKIAAARGLTSDSALSMIKSKYRKNKLND